jgi:hypothetical protein
MNFELIQKGDILPNFVVPNYDQDNDNVVSIICDVCDALESSYDFIFSGFGKERWPVSMGDFSTFIEQIPEALLAIRAKKPTGIDLFEQGIGLFVSYYPSGNNYIAKAKQIVGWIQDDGAGTAGEMLAKWSDPIIETIDCVSLIEMLENIKNNFLRAFNKLSPELVQHPWVKEWLDGKAKVGGLLDLE